MDVTQILTTPPPTVAKQNPATNGADSNSYEAKARGVADKFESFYLYQVLELMHPEQNQDDPLGGGFAEEMFQHTLNEHLANNITGQGGIGIADNIYNELIKLQEITGAK